MTVQEAYEFGVRLGFVKAAALQGMTYDPDNPIVRKLQQMHGANWKNYLAQQRGITPANITPTQGAAADAGKAFFATQSGIPLDQFKAVPRG